jgi:hypothetical protein
MITYWCTANAVGKYVLMRLVMYTAKSIFVLIYVLFCGLYIQVSFEYFEHILKAVVKDCLLIIPECFCNTSSFVYVTV